MKLPKGIFPFFFKPKVAIAKFVWKMQKKSGIMKSGLDAMPLFLLDDLARTYLQPHYGNGVFGNVYLSAGQH